LFHNSNAFGSCIIHILYTGCAKIKKSNSGDKKVNQKLKYLYAEKKILNEQLYNLHLQCAAKWQNGCLV